MKVFKYMRQQDDILVEEEESVSSSSHANNNMPTFVLTHTVRRRLVWSFLLFLYLSILIALTHVSVLQVPEETCTNTLLEEQQGNLLKRKSRQALQALNHARKAVVRRLEAVKPKKEEKPITVVLAAPTTIPTVMKHFNYQKSFSEEPKLTAEEQRFLEEFSRGVLDKIPDLHHRAQAVAWGGSQKWWDTHGHGGPPHFLHVLDGGRLLWSYFVIMRIYMKDRIDLSKVTYPFRLCKDGGCTSDVAIQNTLTWREQYQPWRVTESAVKENESGWVYQRGFSPLAPGNGSYGRHAVLWVRPGMHRYSDPSAYFRCIINSMDRGVAEALHHSHYRVGKVNFIIDGTGYEWSKLPDLAHIKQAVSMLQDHYPDRLGMIFLVNISRTAEILVNLIKPLITKEVREKISVLAHDPQRRLEQLKLIVEEQFIPDWLGGSDNHKFDVQSYYPQKLRWKDEEAKASMSSLAA